jgi:Leucine-rich repeat (LRR) protein
VTISGYTCILSDININVTKETQVISITGVHSVDHNDNDVRNIKILGSHTPFIITEVLEAFQTVEGLEIRKSSLQRIQPFALSTAPNLKNIIIVDNKIPMLEAGSFQGLHNLEVLLLISNHIESISDLAFFGLQKLKVLWITHNRLMILEPTTFGRLVNLKKLIMTHNYLTRLDGQIFANNTQLKQLILNDNKLSEIDSTFINNLKNLEMLKLMSNVCVDQDFIELEKKIEKSDLLAPLDECFDGYALGVTETKELIRDSVQRITIKIQGKFTIFNENGDVLYAN